MAAEQVGQRHRVGAPLQVAQQRLDDRLRQLGLVMRDHPGARLAEVMRQQVIASGVPADAVLVEERSETTKQNAIEVATIIQQHNIKDIILVTSGYHMRRASLEFAGQNADVAVRSHPVATDKQWSNWWWLTPWGWWLSGSELVKIVVLYLGGSR